MGADCLTTLFLIGIAIAFVSYSRRGARSSGIAHHSLRDDRGSWAGGSTDGGASRSAGPRMGGDTSSVSARAQELARNVELASHLGGPGILGTYATDDAAEQLYSNTLTLLDESAGRGQLVMEVGSPQWETTASDKQMVVPVRYLLQERVVSTQIGGQIVTNPPRREMLRERWVWAQTPRRCETCGAPSQPGYGECEYCGAEVRDESRWVLVGVKRA
jgi:hypothetical protein